MPSSGTTTSCPGRFRSSLKRALPRLILVLGYIFYLLIGGLLFSLVEGPRFAELIDQDHDEMDRIDHDRELLLEAFQNATAAAGVNLDQDDLDDLLSELVDAAQSPGYVKDGQTNRTVAIGEEWSFSNAMLFCMTTITTVGYGHLIPHTLIGKVLAMAYTGIGIPLSLLLFADFGYMAAISFMKIFNKVTARCCRCCHKQRGLQRENGKRRPSHISDDEQGGNATVDDTDVKAGDHVLDLTEATSDHAPDAKEERLNGADVKVETSADVGCKHDKEVDDDELLDDVPFYIPPMVFWTYMIFSAPGFGFIEGWSFTTSIYFLYFSVTTVGFGDVVPASNMGMIAAWLGLVVVAMCFFLVYRRIRNAARRVLGFLDSMINKDYQRQRETRYATIEE